MLGLVQLVPKRDPNIPIDRLWLVFFGTDPKHATWWSRWLKPGFEHVSACAWYADQDRWVYYNPTRTGTVVLLYRDSEFGPRFTQMLNSAEVVLRVRGTHRRDTTPFGWWCTGAIKALVGVKTWALSPYQLCGALIRNGAEIVPIPDRR